MGKKELKKNYFDIEAEVEDEEDESFDPEELDGEESGKKEDLTNVEEVDEDEEEEEDDDEEIDERELNYKKRLMDEAEEGSAEEDVQKYNEEDDLAEDGEDLYDEELEEEDRYAELEKEKELKAELREKEHKELVSNLMDILTKSRCLEINNFATLDLTEFDIFELKLSNLAHYQSSVFEKDKYQKEKHKKHLKKVPLNNYMRWNYNETEEITEDLALDKLRRTLGITHKPITMNTNSVMIENTVDKSLKFNINGKTFETNKIKIDSSSFSFALKQNIKDNTDKEVEMISILNKVSGKYILKKNFKDVSDNNVKYIYPDSDSDFEEKKLKENMSKKTKVLNTFLDKNDTIIDKNKKISTKNDLSVSYLEQMMNLVKKDESKYLKRKRR